MPASLPAAPLVSAVLCVRGAASLRPRLEALCAQTLPRDAFEVVVVDDGPADAAAEVARSFEGRLPLRLTRQRAAGIATARNHGLFFSRGVLVLFLDEGVPAPGLLEAHLEAHRRFPEPRFAAVGELVPAPSLAEDPLLRFLEAAPDLEWPRGVPPAGELRGPAHLVAGRASVKRTFLLERGVFHHAFRRRGEDVELAVRLARHGLEVVPVPGARATLEAAPDVDAVCGRLREAGAAAALLAALHDDPEARRLAAVDGAAAEWRALAPTHDAAVRSARELDRLARARAEEGLPPDERGLALLHRSYLAAFQGSRARGAAQAAERPAAAPLDPGSIAP